MGKPKLLLPLGPRRVIEHVLAALAESRIDRTLVVVPPGATDLIEVVRQLRAESVELAAQTADMRSTICAGLAHADRTSRRGDIEAFLIALADQASVTPQVVDHLVDRFRRSSRSILIPTYAGRRGHPVLFAWAHVPLVTALPAGKGINHIVAERAGDVEECPLDEPGLVEDLDTPEDYERALHRRWQ